ncbi:Ig-like protein group 4, partial [Aneurinibacillus soli]
MKKCISMFLCTLMVVLNFQIVSIRPASAALVTKTPTQDAIWDVGGKWPDEPLNYVGYSADNDYGVQRSAVQFDLSDINASVGQAKFRFFVTENQDLTPSDPFIPFVTLYGSSIDSWGTTFPLDAGDLPLYIGRTDIPQGQWREFDVTNFVNSQISTDKKVTFALLGQETVPGAQFNFAGRTYPDASKRPQLVLIPPALQPTVTSTVTAEDTQSGSGLIITKDVADSSSVTHFKISGITGGTLYKNDGTTVIHDGNFITVAEGGAGLKFTPAPDANSPTGGIFGFKVQAAWDSSGSGLSNAAQVAITVTEVNDPPVAVNDSLSSIEADSGARTIPFATLLANDSPGPANESGQVLTITSVDSPVGGTVSISGSNVIFTPSANYHGPASFRYTVQDNGTTNGSANPKTAQATASFTINAPAVKNITAVSPPAAKTGIANGTAKIVSALGLPAQVGVTLSDSSTTNVDVVWDVAGSSYDPSQKTSQTFTVTGTLTNLPSNITNSTNKTASISVTVDAEPTKNITAVSTPPAKTGIANGTDKTVSALGLPAQVGVTLSDNSTANVDVIWDVGGSSYDPSQKTSQTFTVSGTLTNLPSNITNSTNKTTSISVTVDAEPTKDITAVSTPTAKTGIANGTDKTATALGLPAQVGVTLSDSSTTNIDVIWDVASSSYDPSQKTSQTFTVTGTLTNLPNTITNSANKTASISVTVDAEPTKDITAVSTPTARTGVANGSAKTVAALGLPAQVGVTLSDSSTTNVDVIWDVASSSYDPSQKTPQTFTVTGTLTNLPNTITNSANKTASISVTVDAEPTKDITAVSTPTARTGIANGSAKTVSALGLPAQVGVTLSDSSTANVDVIWDVGGSSYDPSQKTSQTFTVSGTLTNLPSNITNSTNKTTSISVTVDAEPTKDITAVSTPTAKTGIANGSAKTVSALGLPAQVGVTLSDNSTANVDVIWDVGGSSYDPSQKTSQTFTVSGTLTNLP